MPEMEKYFCDFYICVGAPLLAEAMTVFGVLCAVCNYLSANHQVCAHVCVCVCSQVLCTGKGSGNVGAESYWFTF